MARPTSRVVCAADDRMQDSWRSWLIAGVGFMIHLLIMGAARASGLLFVALVSKNGVSRFTASWPFTASGAAIIFVAPLTGILSSRFSARTITLTGILLFAVGTSSCFFTTNIYYLTFFYGIVRGSGNSISTNLLAGLISNSFTRHRATAMGLCTTGTPVGAFIFPLTVQYCLEEYGLNGTFLLIGGFGLHAAIGAMFLKPIPTTVKSKLKGVKNTSTNGAAIAQTEFKTGQGTVLSTDVRNRVDEEAMVKVYKSHSKSSINNDPELDVLLRSQDNEVEIVRTQVYRDEAPVEPPAPANREENSTAEKNNSADHTCTPSNHSCSETKHSGDTPECMQLDEKVVEPNKKAKDSTLPEGHSTKPSHQSNGSLQVKCRAPKDPLVTNTAKPKTSKPSMFNTTVFANILSSRGFFLVAGTQIATMFVLNTFNLVTVDYLVDKGIDVYRGAFVITVFSVGQVVGRLGLGWLTDRKIVSRPIFLAVVLGLISIVIVSFPHTNDLAALLMLAGLLGMVQGTVLPVVTVTLSDYLRKEEIHQAVSCSRSLRGIFSFAKTPMIGFFRDDLGSYDNMFRFVGGLTFLASLAWTTEAIRQRRHSNKMRQEMDISLDIT